jgi:hypothetical protein
MDERLSPEEFARLMSLSPDHPDRIRAAATPEFAALSTMWSDFEQSVSMPASAGDVESARTELRRRIDPVLERGAPVLSDAGLAAREGPQSDAGGGGLATLLRGPAARFGLTFAGLALVAGMAWWWSGAGDQGRAVRGESSNTGFGFSSIRMAPGAVLLEWRPEAGADAYRITFLGPDLREIARLDEVHSTDIALQADALPAGLKSGKRVAIELVALRGGDSIATAPARSVRLP